MGNKIRVMLIMYKFNFFFFDEKIFQVNFLLLFYQEICKSLCGKLGFVVINYKRCLYRKKILEFKKLVFMIGIFISFYEMMIKNRIEFFYWGFDEFQCCSYLKFFLE